MLIVALLAYKQLYDESRLITQKNNDFFRSWFWFLKVEKQLCSNGQRLVS